MTYVLVGYDTREPVTFSVCERSLRSQRRPRDPDLQIVPIVQDKVRKLRLYTRQEDPRAATQFSLTRFLVPWLSRERYAIFCDCDFIFTRPIEDLVQETIRRDPGRAVWVVHHDSEKLWGGAHAFERGVLRSEPTKMDGKVQERYPRKWWSALMIWDCFHPDVHPPGFTQSMVDHLTPGELHRFSWLPERSLGQIDPDWHWLDGYSPDPPEGHTPAGIHLTRGTPEHGPPWDRTRYADLWRSLAG